MKKIIAIVLALLMISMTSCAAKENNVKDNETTAGDVTEAPSDTTAELEFYKTDEEVFEIETSFCSLKFPVKWKDYVSTSLNETENGCSIVFTAYLEETSLGLYTVTFGESDSGYMVGTVNTEKGSKEVYLTDQYDAYSESLSEDARQIYLQMSEDVNVIISKLVYDNKMELS